MMIKNTLELVAYGPVIPVIVIEREADAVPLARALVAGGVRVLEVTLRTRVALSCIEAIVAAKVSALRFASATTSPNAPTVSGSSPTCHTCGPRPEPDAIFCSSCGRPLQQQLTCDRCLSARTPGSRFCEACGRQVAA